MRAVVIHAAKDLRIDEIAPASPGPRDVRVRIETGGICGSDLHYYHEGRIGTILLKEPMVLGHEIAGLVDGLGGEVSGLKSGDRVAVSPSRPCGACRFCQGGQQIHCLDMRFYGSAMRVPHVQGAFREMLVADAGQCHVVPASLTAGEAAMAEPLAVCLHAARRAGPLLGKRVLVTGSGPIGALCAICARRAGAVEVVATDIADAPGAFMRQLDVDRFLNVAREGDALAAYARDKGQFDVLMEASGSQEALVAALSRAAGRRSRPGWHRSAGHAAPPRRGRQGARAARHLPFPRRVRAGNRAARQAPDRREAADYGHAAVHRGSSGLRSRVRPFPRHEGATRLHLSGGLICAKLGTFRSLNFVPSPLAGEG